MNAALRAVLLSLEPLKLENKAVTCPIATVDYCVGLTGNLYSRSAEVLPSWDENESTYCEQLHYEDIKVDDRGYDVAVNAHRLMTLITRLTHSGNMDWVSKAEADVFINDYLTRHNLCLSQN